MVVGNSGLVRYIFRFDILEIESVISLVRLTSVVSIMENGTLGLSRRFKSVSMRSNFFWEDERDVRDKKN